MCVCVCVCVCVCEHIAYAKEKTIVQHISKAKTL